MLKHLVSLAVLLLASCWATLISANETLGVLIELTNPESEIAKQLDLNNEQLGQLKQLSTRRISAAIGLSSQLREAPKSEHAKLMAEFVAESERLAFELLNADQQAKLAKLRIQWLGLVSLADEKIAESLNLADWQKQVVTQWRDQLRLARRANNEDKVKPQADRAIRRELSDTQWAAWQFMAGLISENAAGAPQPPDRSPAADQSTTSPSTTATANTSALTPEQAASMPVEEVKLTLNFQKQPWGDVIKWLADQADLSVQSEIIPPGSFTYRDRSRQYTVPETLDIMNRYLLDSGFNLFRSGRLLRCINFEEDQEKRGELIVEIADDLSVEDLKSNKYGRFEPVRVLFTLKRLDPESVKEEVAQLLSIQGTVKAFTTSGQLLVTDMAGNVRNIAEFIERAEDPLSIRGAGVLSIPLKVINAEEVLTVARPLLELQEGTNVSDKIKISTNTFGTVIYAKGEADRIQILKDLVEQMDRQPEEISKPVTYEATYVGKHSVQGLDVELAYQVISQLLAGTPDVRLARDETSKQLILQGRKADHEIVRTTLETLAGQKSTFEVIQLERLDPQMAIAAVKKFFGLSDKPSADSGEPVIDGDLLARQLWVKGNEEQVARIRNLIKELEGNAKANKNIWGDRIRMLPSNGGSAEAIKQAEVLWQQMYGQANPIVRDSGTGIASGGLKAKTYAPERRQREGAGKKKEEVDQPANDSQTTEASSNDMPSKANAAPSVETSTQKVGGELPTKARLVSTAQQTDKDAVESTEASQSDSTTTFEGSPIVIREGPGGLMISSDDTEALDRFEMLLRTIMEQTSLGGDAPEVIYLQNIKAAAAKELLTEVLSGAASSGSGGGGLLGDMATSVLGGFGGGMLGSLLGGGGGSGGSSSTVALATGEYSIVADPRLNALFVSASPPDRLLIEQILKVIDQPESPYPIETRGTTELIPVVTQDVNAVLATVKSVFGDRIEGNSSNRGGGGNAQPNPAEFIQAMRAAVGGGGRGGRGGANSELTEPKISVSADTFTNTLVVVAQPQQIDEVRRLVAMIDEAGEGEKEEIQVVDLGAISSTSLTDSLKRILGTKAQANSSGTTTSSTGSSQATGQSDADAARRRAEFFQNIMQQQRGAGASGFGNTGGGRGAGGNTGGGNFGGGNRGGGNFGGGNRGGGNR